MPEPWPHQDPARIDAIETAVAALLATSISFVSDAPMTVAQLLTTYPADATRVGKYARVTDLWGDADEVMRCTVSGTGGGAVYRWRPQRENYAKQIALASGNMNLTPLVTPPQLRVTTNLTGAVNVTPLAANAYYGQTFDITMAGTLGIFLFSILGLIGGTQLLGAGQTKRLIYTPDGYYAQ